MEKEKKIGEWKGLMVEELTEDLKKNNDLYISDYIGLKADEVNELRRMLEKSLSSYKIVKNSMAKIALENAGLKDLTKFVSGGTGLAFGGNDPVAVARVMANFSKAHKALKLKGGMLDGTLIDIERIRYLASLPGRDELIAKTVYAIKSPISGFVGVLGNLIKGFVYVIQAIKDNKGGQNG